MAVDVAELLSRELGPDRVLRTPEQLEDYGRDESGRGVFPPDARRAVRLARGDRARAADRAEHKVPVTPRGAGTGMTGGALPVRGGVVLSTERMKRIKEIERRRPASPSSSPASSPASCRRPSRRRACSTRPIPASLEMCSIGGNVAENAGGPRAFKYGVTRDCTCSGLDVDAHGRRDAALRAATPKGVTGYDLTALFVGSEGTFGVTSELTVKLVPSRPRPRRTLVAIADAMTAGRAVERILRNGLPAARARARWIARRSTTSAPKARLSRSPRAPARSC